MAKDPKRQYDELAAEYDTRWARYIERSVQATLDRMALREGESVLDLGCGVLLDRLGPGVRRQALAGVDVSREMLAVARRRLGAGVRLMQARAEALPFADGSFDVIVSSSSFHYWAEPARGLKEVRRVLKPGGRIVVTDWCDDYFFCKVCDLVLRVIDRGHRACYGTGDCEQYLKGAGFRDVRIERYKISPVWGLMTGMALRTHEADCRKGADTPALRLEPRPMKAGAVRDRPGPWLFQGPAISASVAVKASSQGRPQAAQDDESFRSGACGARTMHPVLVEP